jgi:type II secretory ATPase GspE/PulE/Tfp pilus assembly ATPase PilB-like protein
VMNNEMRRLIVKGGSFQELVEEARRGGYRTMFEDGLDKVDAGLTTLEEVMRVTRTVLEDDLFSADQSDKWKK